MTDYEASASLNSQTRFVFKAPETQEKSRITESAHNSILNDSASNKSILNASFASSESTDTIDRIVKVILQNGIEHASSLFGFRLNTTGIKRPDRRSRIGKELTARLENIGYKFESNRI